MKRFWIMSLVVLVVLSFALPSLAQDGPVTVTISTWAGVDESAELQLVLDEINEGNDVFQIVHQPNPADYYTTIQVQMAGGEGADMYWLSQEWVPGLASQGALLDLTDCLAGAEAGSAGDVSDYYPDVIGFNYYQDGIYGLPWIAQPVVLFYNRALFDAAGLDYPDADWTWYNFLLMAAALTQDTDGDGETDQWGFSATGWPPPQMFIWQAGGSNISEDRTESPIDSPEAIEAVEFYLQLAYGRGGISPDRATVDEQGFGEMFKAGVIAMFMGGAGDDLDRVEGLDVGVVSVPRHPRTRLNTTFSWSASTVVWSGTEHPEEVCAALQAVTDGIHHWKIVSPRVSQTTVEHLVASEPRKEASAEAIIAAVPSMRAFRVIPRHSEWDGVFWGEFMTPLINGDTDLSVGELAVEVRPELDELFEED